LDIYIHCIASFFVLGITQEDFVKNQEMLQLRDKEPDYEIMYNSTIEILHQGPSAAEFIECLEYLFKTVPESRKSIVQHFDSLIRLVEKPSQELKDECSLCYDVQTLLEIDNFSEEDAQQLFEHYPDGMTDFVEYSKAHHRKILFNDPERLLYLLRNKIVKIEDTHIVKDNDWYEGVILRYI